MKWFPNLNISNEYDKWLTDMELMKVKQLKKSLRQHHDLEVEKEIYHIYLMAIQRHKKEVLMTEKLIKWLNAEELEQLNEWKDKIITERNEHNIFLYEACIYELFHHSICRQMDYPFNKQVEKYIDMMKKCETNREADIVSSILIDWLRLAK